MTGHWDNELAIIKLGREAALPYLGVDTNKEVFTIAQALRHIEHAIEERNQLMGVLHNACADGGKVKGWNDQLDAFNTNGS